MHGATFGLKPTLLQSNYYRPQPKARNIDSLYFAGSGNHPGAGVPIVLTSAKLVVEEILKDDK
jgi:phytoene desaturase